MPTPRGPNLSNAAPATGLRMMPTVGCGDCGVDQSDQNRGVAEVAGGKGVNAQQWLIELDLLVYECDEGHKTNDD